MYLWAKLLRNEVRTELIEEPEAHLHPSIVRRFARTLSKLVEEQGNEKQVILATHSEQFVASLLVAVSEKILPSGHIQCYLSDKSGSSTTFQPQKVNDDGQIEGGLVTFVESQLEDIKSLFGIS
jgi:predicted ATPase